MVELWDAEGARKSPGSHLGLSWKPFGGLGGTSKAFEGSLGQLLGALEGYRGTWIALEALLGDKVGAHGGPEYAKPWGEYPKPSWATAMGAVGRLSWAVSGGCWAHFGLLWGAFWG